MVHVVKGVIKLFFLIGIAVRLYGQSPEELKSVFELINKEALQQAECYENLSWACSQIGHRLTGSENGEKAEEFTHDLFEKYGFERLKYFPFTVTAWSRVSCEVKVGTSKDDWEPIKAVSLAHSPVKSSIEADIVDVGSGLEKDYFGKEGLVKDRVVLLSLGLVPSDSMEHNLHRSEKAAIAISHGVAGIIFINGVDGGVLLTGTASVDGDLIPVPAVCIGKEDGARVRDMVNSGQILASINSENKSEPLSARNVIATIPGTVFPDEHIVVGGHLDSWDLSTGAIDNGIGSFTVIEIARIFKKLDLKPKRTIDFVMFMGEEQGLLGSSALVNFLVEENSIGQIKCMVNLDMAGNAIGFGTGGRQEMKDFISETGYIIRSVDTVFANKVSESAGLHSDHQPFMLQGVPVIGIVSHLDPYVYRYYHSDGDAFELVNRDHMVNCARFTAMMLYALSCQEKFPADRMTSDQTRDFLIEHGLKEKLILGGQWKWDD